MTPYAAGAAISLRVTCAYISAWDLRRGWIEWNCAGRLHGVDQTRRAPGQLRCRPLRICLLISCSSLKKAKGWCRRRRWSAASDWYGSPRYRRLRRARGISPSQRQDLRGAVVHEAFRRRFESHGTGSVWGWTRLGLEASLAEAA